MYQNLGHEFSTNKNASEPGFNSHNHESYQNVKHTPDWQAVRVNRPHAKID